MLRKICAGIVILASIAAVGCTGAEQELSTAEQSEATNITEQFDLTETSIASEKTTQTNTKNSSENQDERTISNTTRVTEKSDKIGLSKSEVYTNGNITSSQRKEEVISDQENEIFVESPYEEDIIFADPQLTTQAANKSTSTKTTTTQLPEREDIIVTESVIELPFIPVG